MTLPAIRLFHRDTNRHFIVAGTEVYADRKRVRRISSHDRMLGPIDGVTPNMLRDAADYFTTLYEAPIDGTPNVDHSFRSAGPLSRVEVQQLERDPDGVPAVRTALERHLDFFDCDSFDGRITLRENWRGWRRLGYGYLKSIIGTLGAAMIFGRIRDGFAIDIARIKEKRRGQSTGLYDANGQVNEALLQQYLAAFRQKARYGVITQDDAAAIIESRADLGMVSKRQFKSLFGLCTRLNRNQKVITEHQFAALFDGSLLYLAASIPDAHGRRGLLRRPVGAPLVVTLAVIAMTAIFAPRSIEPAGLWHVIGGWLLAAASWLLYVILAWRSAVERSVVLILGVLAAASVWTSLSLMESLAVWPIILVTAAMAIGQQWRPVLQYTFYLRFPLLLALTTMALPAIAIWGAPLLFKSMFMLEWGGLMFVVLLAVLVAYVSLASARLIARNAERRLGEKPWHGPADLIDRRGWVFALLITLPIIVSLVWLSESERPIAALAAFGGILLAVALKALARRVASRSKFAERARHVVGRTLEQHPVTRPGYVNEHGHVLPGHLGNAGLFLITLALYGVGYFVLRPAGLVQAPALAFVLFILIMLGWLLPAVSFFADKYRVSTVIALAVVPYVLYFINDIDHYYQASPMSSAAAQDAAGASSSELRTAFDTRLERVRALYPGSEPVIVAVAAGGGGGSAALWSARVLAGLQQQFGPRFTDSIQMVSAVSGGSVGTMYFLSAFDSPANGERVPAPSDSRLDDVVRAAGQSTLGSVAWGLSYPDLWRVLSLRHPDPYLDRGWALEEALDAQLADRGVRLSQWRGGILAGWRPTVLFNATVSESGDRLVISPLRLHRANQACREPDVVRAAGCEDQIDAATLDEISASNPDVRVATAARLSATFPFVLPIPKARQLAEGEKPYHVADGGYYDNGGVLTLVEWAQKAMTFATSSNARKLLVIDIRVVDPVEGPRDRAGWIYATLGPVVTMLNVRGTSQIRRNRVDMKLLSDLRQAGEFAIRHVEFPLTLLTSRSWHLPASEREAIDAYWETDATVRRAREEICSFLGPAEWNCATTIARSSP